MTRRHLHRSSAAHWTAPAALVGLLALGGCSSTTTDSAPQSGPVTAILDSLWATQDDDGDRWATDLENSIARCMSAQGFEYIPSTDGYSIVTGTSIPELPTEDWVRVNGYGISSEGADLTLPDTPAPVHEFVDPNADYVASLSPAEHAAYTAALFGAPSTETGGADADTEYHWEDAGCTGAGQHELTAATEALQSSSVFIDFNKAMDALDQSARTAPATVEASARWSDCMADAGYPGHPTPADVRAALAAAWEDEYAPSAEFAGGFTGPSSVATAQFRAKEIETALADFTCKQDVGWVTTLSAVEVELEESFIKDHKAELDEYVAAVEAARK